MQLLWMILITFLNMDPCMTVGTSVFIMTFTTLTGEDRRKTCQ